MLVDDAKTEGVGLGRVGEGEGPRWDRYGTPGTGFPLDRVGHSLLSPRTGGVFPIADGIPRFLKFPTVETPAEEAAFAELNRRADEDGWQAALAATTRNDPDRYTYVTDRSRLAQLDILPLPADATLLEVGPSLGQFTTELAARVRDVYALEVAPWQAAFLQKRLRQTGITNVAIACGGDDCRLPYRSETFDVAIVNLVLEWCASRLVDEEPLTGQRRLIAELVRVLKPGGVLYLATKNRYGLPYLLGQPDEHQFNMRWASPLPRWLTRLRLAVAKRPRPPGLLHSYSALRTMLTEAGLPAPQSFWAAPEMRFPTHLIPTDAASIRRARRAGVVQGPSRKTRLLMPFVPDGLVKHFAPGLAFLAAKPGRHGGPTTTPAGP